MKKNLQTEHRSTSFQLTKSISFKIGYLVFKSGYLLRIIGLLLFVAGFGYLIDSIIFFFNPDFGVTFSEFIFLGELLITFWLLIKGVNIEEWNKRALKSA